MCSSNSINIYDATIRRQLFTPSETNRIRSNALFKTAGFYLACSSHFLPLPLLAGTVFAVFCLFVCLFVNANVLGRFHEILEVVRLWTTEKLSIFWKWSVTYSRYFISIVQWLVDVKSKREVGKHSRCSVDKWRRYALYQVPSGSDYTVHIRATFYKYITLCSVSSFKMEINKIQTCVKQQLKRNYDYAFCSCSKPVDGYACWVIWRLHIRQWSHQRSYSTYWSSLI